MSVFGEAALSAILELLSAKLLDSVLNFVADYREVHQQLKLWQSILPEIKAVLNHAEEKQIKDEGVKNWLDDLQDLAYDVDDILDDFAYQELRLKLQKTQAQASTSKIQKLIPTCCAGGNFSPISFMFNAKMISKIKAITDRLNSLNTRRNSLGLSEIMNQGATSKEKKPRLQPTSLMDGAVEYVGRANEKQEMLELLKSNNSDGVCVLSIVGMGGMGKTTLAQLVYNDPSIEESFDHKSWVCVSDDFDAGNITKTILRSLDADSRDENDLNLLQVKLKEKLSGKRLLLVLDDIWNESYSDWIILRAPFGAGTKIIVTTRLQKVSSNVDSAKAFYLDKLSHHDCLSIFAQHALKARNFDGHLQFKEIGENIVRRCNGLPLAAKAIGSLLRTVQDHSEWEKIYESEIWDLQEDPCGLIPALRLSYRYLPPHLKRCFAYCSIFPKDYEFEEEEIILLWRAEGFLQSKAKIQGKGLGNQYFQDLVSRSFFQRSSKDKSRFVMHDLMNDLAQLVAGEICCRLEGEKQQKFSRSRHSAYVSDDRYHIVKKFEAFYQMTSLRTFLPLPLMAPRYKEFYLSNVVLDDLLPRLSYLRVLSLRGYEIYDLPDFFENLKHLHYLNFSGTQINRLPDSLCTLYHLETLILRYCLLLKNLPSKIGNLVNLHFLDIRGADSIERMPSGFDQLTKLQILSNFVIGEGDRHLIRELKNLSNLRGNFCLSGLENVNGQDAREAKLNEKLGIDGLELQWGADFENSTRKKEVEERVLDFLRPQKKLEQLIIENYGGVNFSSWIADSSFKSLSSLKLRNCKNCKSLPSVGRLPFLKDLSIIGFDQVQKIGVELFGENQLNPFASLEILSFEILVNWKEWDTCEGDEKVLKLPSLRELSIKNCPQLLGRLPTHLPSLQKLEIRGCWSLVVSISSFPSLCELSVRGCAELVDDCSSPAKELSSLQTLSLSNISKFNIPADRTMLRFGNSEHFEIHDLKKLASLSQHGFSLVGHRFISVCLCPQLQSLEAEEVELQPDKISRVESLKIASCGRLNRLPRVLHELTFLTVMEIRGCRGLVSFAENNFPPNLKKLKIGECENLEYLVDEKEDNKSMSSTLCLLQDLSIYKCPSLMSLSSKGHKNICNQLQLLEIKQCSKLSCLFANTKFLITLKHLTIWDCPELEYIAQDFEETACLESILISGSGIKSLPRGLDKLIHLQKISLSLISNLVPFEESGLLTTSLRAFEVYNCENFGALPKCMASMTSLRELCVWNCSADISFPSEGFPANLTSLEISNAPKIYRSLVEWGLNRLTCLQALIIRGGGCSNVVSFPEEGIGMMLPPSLTRIELSEFENLEFMFSQGFQDLASLQELEIHKCPKLTSLPEKDMLLSLGYLSIYSCPLLKEECSSDKGQEWSKISHIPHVVIHGKTVIPRESD
ncbi:putative disease resistance RPP13-like protein 1 isoform X1 [Gossypium arboreum]|uniref:putative disease resistance RPP13-like protein 1 isoform X1 n=2 Tax=Gossypium arboreum TaxID=29729 RepID=UPI000819145E|nr:putative disease resistance RPP13-like protein 1 isoform X1 [Gossypium arboreum]